ncbi:hypothetical protein LZG04_32180 [Saccharothrix sp. S26]|uniref:hypothetical protein n=1 Tax=Saccharothrix sp. S26 TaxID=2907215 RepID=UPI001F2592E3|nr:hypothetical protein [Saccharothrix sp. S26]MCE6999434.1 hypothetical protein [Saccharothrix sp. S26]
MTRWVLLYARARHVPVSAAAAAVGVGGLGALAQPGGSPQSAAFGAALGMAAVATGLGGHDRALDRTAAFGWPPRRAAHLLLGGTVVAALLLAVGLVADPLAPDAFLLRDVAGLGGLAALGALWFGSRTACVLPLGWAGVTLVVPPGDDDWLTRLLTWPVQPAGTTSATVTAVVLGGAGLLAHSWFGCRR